MCLQKANEIVNDSMNDSMNSRFDKHYLTFKEGVQKMTTSHGLIMKMLNVLKVQHDLGSP